MRFERVWRYRALAHTKMPSTTCQNFTNDSAQKNDEFKWVCLGPTTQATAGSTRTEFIFDDDGIVEIYHLGCWQATEKTKVGIRGEILGVSKGVSWCTCWTPTPI